MMTLVKLDLPTVEDVVSRLRAGEFVRIEIPVDNFDRRPLESLVKGVNKRMKNDPIGRNNTHIGRTMRILNSDDSTFRVAKPEGYTMVLTGRSAVAWKRRYPEARLVVDIEPLP